MKILAPNRVCPECGSPFVATHGRQQFCSGEHQRKFNRVMAYRGGVLTPFALVSRRGKSGFTDERRYALRQFNALCDRWNAEDKAAGRRPDLVVGFKFHAQWAAADLD